jgi:cobalt/nickel transport system ATP-binding protein
VATLTVPLIKLDDVHFGYRASPALSGVSLTINAGERVALMGANGSGKSTLLRLLDALAFPASGRLEIFGTTINESAMQDDEANFAFRRRVGLVFQNPDIQLFNPTVFDELAFGPLQLGWDKPRIRQAIDEMLIRFDIAHLKDRPPHRLSGGEKKRVALASVLIMDPEMLLLDEPTAALDPESRDSLVQFLASGLGEGRTVITATHDLDIVEDIAERAIVLDKGRVASDGSVFDLLHDSQMLKSARLVHVHRHTHNHGEQQGEVPAHDHGHYHGND